MKLLLTTIGLAAIVGCSENKQAAPVIIPEAPKEIEIQVNSASVPSLIDLHRNAMEANYRSGMEAGFELGRDGCTREQMKAYQDEDVKNWRAGFQMAN